MSLFQALQRRGYPIRQHLPEEGWGMRKLTVVDLNSAQRQALEQDGLPGLQRLMDEQGSWTFPAIDAPPPGPRFKGIVLAETGESRTTVVASQDQRDAAEQLIERIAERCGVRLPLVDDEAGLDLLDREHLIVLGRSHRNRLATQLALRSRTGIADATVPGDDGWLVTTIAGVNAAGHGVVQLVASESNRAEACDALLDAVEKQGDRILLTPIHRVSPGSVMRDYFPSWEQFTARMPRELAQLSGKDIDGPTDPAALADILAAGFDSGGIEKSLANCLPIDMTIRVARYYQCSAEPRALQLFREMLFRFVDYYLKTPQGASYPSDLDFRLGPLVLYYSRLEHERVFSEEDRLILTAFLLSCSRSIYEYATKQWPVQREAPTRHNHETFPALSLQYCADYFSRLGVTEVDRWRDYTDVVFDPSLWRRSKQKENARLYEGFVFHHAAAYLLHAGKELGPSVRTCLRQIVERQMATTDNFMYAVDYGDAHVSFSPANCGMARLLDCLEDAPRMRWFGNEDFRRAPIYPKTFMLDYPGVRRADPGNPPPAGQWELAPLDEVFRQQVAPELPAEYAFDKLAFRTGWGDRDHYLLFEGVGNLEVSHAHLELNGIVRLNHLGRHWLVSNGYGRRAGVTNVSKAYSSRVRGPDDHNMLVQRQGDQILTDAPAGVAMLQRGRQHKLLYTTGAVLGYGLVDWFRTLIVLADAYVLAIDRIKVNGPGLDAAHIEWNGLGEAHDLPDGVRLEQQGPSMWITSPSGWTIRRETADRSATWQTALAGDAYPFAEFPLKKLVYEMPLVEPGRSTCLATLMAADESQVKYAVEQPAAGHLVIHGPHDDTSTKVHDGDLEIIVASDRAEVRYAALPDVPAAL